MSTSVHLAELVAEHLPTLPLCWVADGKQRGATVEEWEVTFDHADFLVDAETTTGERGAVTCSSCREWMHA